MLSRERAGELLLGLVFVGAGVFWVHQALKLPLWEGFAPSSGFLPLIFGVLLSVLAAVAIAVDVLLPREEPDAEPAPVRRTVMVILAMIAAVAGIEAVGFAASVFLAMLFLYVVVERHSILVSLLASGGIAAMLTVVFRSWLGVPLPAGPWGF